MATVNVDTTLNKIKSIIRTPNLISHKSLAGSRNIGIMLDDYFADNHELSFDLLMNALVLFYDIPAAA